MAFPESTAWALNGRLLPGFPRVRAAGDPPPPPPAPPPPPSAAALPRWGVLGVTAAKPAPPHPERSTSRLSILTLPAVPSLSKISLSWSLCGQGHPELPGGTAHALKEGGTHCERHSRGRPRPGTPVLPLPLRHPMTGLPSPAGETPPPRHSQSLQVVQPLEAVGPQMLDVVVMEMPVWEERRVRTGVRSIGLGRESRHACGGSMDSDPRGSAFVCRDKPTGQDGLRKPQSPRLEWPGATPFRLPIEGENRRHSTGRGEAGSHQAPTRLEGRGPMLGPQLGLPLRDPQPPGSGPDTTGGAGSKPLQTACHSRGAFRYSRSELWASSEMETGDRIFFSLFLVR